MGQSELVGKTFQPLRFFDRVEILSLKVFYQPHGQCGFVADSLDNDGDFGQAGKLRGAPSPLPRNQFVPGQTVFPHNDGLYHALCFNRIRQLLQGFVIDLNTRLIAAGLDIFNCNRGQPVAAAVVCAVGEQRIQTAPQSAFYFCHAFLPYVFKCNDKVGILSDIECCRQFVSVFISNRFFSL